MNLKTSRIVVIDLSLHYLSFLSLYLYLSKTWSIFSLTRYFWPFKILDFILRNIIWRSNANFQGHRLLITLHWGCLKIRFVLITDSTEACSTKLQFESIELLILYVCWSFCILQWRMMISVHVMSLFRDLLSPNSLSCYLIPGFLLVIIRRCSNQLYPNQTTWYE